MSFAGHVFDMIRRDKAYRDDRKLRRDRMKRGRGLYVGSGMPANVTAEELEEVNRRIKAREEQQQRYFTRMKIIALGILAVITLLVGGLLMLVL